MTLGGSYWFIQMFMLTKASFIQKNETLVYQRTL